MEPTVHFITLGVPDVAQARRFYVDGLGWAPLFEVPGEVVFIQVGHGLVLSLFGAADLAADSGGGALAPGAASPVTLAHNVATEADVVAALDAAQRAGGTILKPAQHAEWGGFHGYFADPAGFRWEVAMNPGWSIEPDGTVHIGPVDAA